jgi:hypothetical protein
MAWKTGAVPVVAGLGLESDANLFIYLFRKKKRIGVPRSTTRVAGHSKPNNNNKQSVKNG